MTEQTSQQPNVLVPLDPQSGAIGSALSLPRQDEPGGDLHHHEDIVEHLDVIGVCLNPTGYFFIYFVRLDPAVATVSSLANGANALLM